MKPYYEQDGITIYHGDCREMGLSDHPFGLLLTDPPYCSPDIGKLNRAKGSSREWHSVGVVDVPMLLQLNCPSVIFGANFFSSDLPSAAGWIVWDKQADGFRQGSPCELAWSNYFSNIKLYRQHYRGFTTRDDPKHHPMQKPIGLLRWILSLPETPRDGTVVDPYMGSGSTLAACKSVGRHAIGVETEERYCEIAAKRLSQKVMKF